SISSGRPPTSTSTGSGSSTSGRPRSRSARAASAPTGRATSFTWTPVGSGSGEPAAAGAAVSDRVELPGDVVREAPEIADVGLADDRVGAPAVAPPQDVQLVAVLEAGRDVLSLGRRDHDRQRADRLVVGRVEE